MATLTLSNTAIDFESIRAQLEAHVATQDTWKGFHATQTGQTLIDLIAATGTLNSVALLRYFQDAFPSTALSDEAIYNLASAQGVRINRKIPMEITVRMISPGGAVFVPKFTQFTVGGIKFFNREAFTVTATFDPLNAQRSYYRLQQGEVVRFAAAGLGTNYQVFRCAEREFAVSDFDVEVRINGETIERVTEGLWKLRVHQGYRDRTMPNGQAALEFGNEQYGSRPGPNDTVEITYAITDGLAISTAKTIEKKIKCDSFPTIEGTATANPSGGADQRPIELYKNITAPSFGTFGSAVTRDQYVSTMLSYPGIVDATIFAQRDLNPNAAQWMNLMRMVVMTESAWTDADRAAFVEYMQSRSMYAVRLTVDHPTPVSVLVNAVIYCYAWADRTRCRQAAEIAVRQLFTPRPGIIGYNIYLSDLYKTIKDADPGIEYVDLLSPTKDLHVANEPMDAPWVVAASATGFLPAGEYHWAVSPVLATGEVAPKNFTSFRLDQSNRAILISWPIYPNAIGYKVWGRKHDRIGLLATRPNASVHWVDDGTVPDPAIGSLSLTQTTAPLRFNSLQSVIIDAQPSSRSTSSYTTR